MKGKKILIIDDDTDFGFLMTEFFSKRGGKVLVAKSITEGLLFLRNEKHDYIFLDNHLPDGLGWGKTEYILANYPNTRLILISSLEVPKSNSSSFGILFKPLIKEELHKMFD
jgi:DNA-binding response OmpR family regulator